MSKIPTIEVTDGKRSMRINEADKAEWAKKGWLPPPPPSPPETAIKPKK